MYEDELKKEKNLSESLKTTLKEREELVGSLKENQSLAESNFKHELARKVDEINQEKK